MERRELAERYLEGQLSRRVFLRRLVATGVSVVAVSLKKKLLVADPARAAAYDYYVYVSDFAYNPPNLKTAGLGQTVEWGFGASGYTHSATDPTGAIDSGFKNPYSAYDQGMPFAGTYNYVCAETTHPLMHGKVSVPVAVGPTSGPLGTAFAVGWSQISPIPAPYVVDVQRRRPSDSGFKNWLAGTSTRAISYTPTSKGTYAFRARLRNKTNGKRSAWSPAATFKVT